MKEFTSFFNGLEKCNFRVVYFPSARKNIRNKISVSGKYILNTFLKFR